ncbi:MULTISPECIES: alpha/beta hydrolase [Amycolatopsis]|uniref:Dienelactone hydrolase family protein n=1 Tax=Amycolatopsis dongchuanensis TaxID=1070866 RepID=A0ABP8VHR5_9PSEU
MTVPVTIDVGAAALHGDLTLPADATGLVVLAADSDNSRSVPRVQALARTFQDFRFGTLLFDLLVPDEEAGVDLLTRRLLHVLDDLTRRDATANLPLGLFAASAGAAAALAAAAAWPEEVYAVVASGGRPDLAADALPRVTAPTLLIVGGKDPDAQRVNEESAQRLGGPSEVKLVTGASACFEEPGTLEEVAALAASWFTQHLV